MTAVGLIGGLLVFILSREILASNQSKLFLFYLLSLFALVKRPELTALL
jgi:hypothetical protein